MSSWADAIHAANPDNPAIAAQAQRFSSADKVKLLELIGTIGGGLIGALVVLAFQRRRAARHVN